MEIREWAIRILSATTLEEKLLDPGTLTDKHPGEPLRFNEPVRPSGLSFSNFTKKDRLPPFHEHKDHDKRVICLHRFAGHELLAVELMAFALLSFPKAPKHFRMGLANTLKEEQWHVQIYQKRLSQMGCSLSDLPFNNRFWKLTKHIHTPLEFISVMHLTLEMANLDFAPHYGASFLRSGDKKSSDLMRQIYLDEISHVGFGYHWLKKLKPANTTEWDCYMNSLNKETPPKRAKGFIFLKEPRIQAGLSSLFIDRLQKSN